MPINLTLRSIKGSPLSATEADANFTALRDSIAEALSAAGVTAVNGRSGNVVITATDVTDALGYVPAAPGGAAVTSFNTRSGAITLTSLDVTTALGYTPAVASVQAAGSVGQLAYFPTASAPTGWLLANGAAVSRTTYSALFAVIGTTYGVGDGSTTFNVPDLRGEFIRGLDLSRGIDAGRTLGSLQTDALANHRHGFMHSAPQGSGLIWATGDDPGGNSATLYSVGDGTETRPRNVAMTACICAYPMASGAPGEAGPQGPQGPEGPQGPAGTVSTTDFSVGSYLLVQSQSPVTHGATATLYTFGGQFFDYDTILTPYTAISGTWKCRGSVGDLNSSESTLSHTLYQRTA